MAQIAHFFGMCSSLVLNDDGALSYRTTPEIAKRANIFSYYAMAVDCSGWPCVGGARDYPGMLRRDEHGGWTTRVIRAAFASSLAPSCQQRASRTIMEVVSVVPHRAQGLSWHVDWYGISPSDLAAVWGLVTAHGSEVR